MKEVVLDPRLWESLEPGVEALLEQWLAAEGEQLRAGQVLARAVLVKASVEVPAPASGVLEEILVAAGQNFPCGAVLARVRET
jgi:pyruvate/2-oxoglutarate dehydrogenase complex dihydrolipoamide acyltransferase (E2) component